MKKYQGLTPDQYERLYKISKAKNESFEENIEMVEWYVDGELGTIDDAINEIELA